MSGERLLLDTNVIIGFLKGETHIVRFLDKRLKEGAVLFASQISRNKGVFSGHADSNA